MSIQKPAAVVAGLVVWVIVLTLGLSAILVLRLGVKVMLVLLQ